MIKWISYLNHPIIPSSIYPPWRNFIAFGLGICCTLALPPFFLFPLLIPAFGGLYVLTNHAATHRRAFLDGWWWGWGFHITGLYWFCIALLTDPEKFAWLIPFTLFGLTAVIALYAGAACWLFSFVRLRGISRVYLFSLIWTLAEYARGHLFTGFPWNLAGYSFTFSDAAMQLGAVIGIYGLTWWGVFLGAIPAALLSGDKRARPAVAMAYILLAAGVGWGAWRLHEADKIPESERYVKNVRIRLVQANVDQGHKWDPALQMRELNEHIRLTRAPGIEKITHVIWPETAIPFVVEPGTELTRILGNAVPPGAVLISGALRQEGKHIYNSIVAVDHPGAMVGFYDKAKLVPFGEFLPFRAWLPAFLTTPVGEMDFARGPGPRTVSWPGLPPLSPLVCYEAIFPELAVDAAKRPQWLLNLTNDAWFGLSSGPYQHFHMARMRAVEQGLPLVRAANTGISAVTDSYGRVQQYLRLGAQGTLDLLLQKAQLRDTTIIMLNKYFLPFLILVGVFLIIWQRKRSNN